VRATIATLCIALLALLVYWLWTPDKDRSALERKYLSRPGDMVDVGPWRLRLLDTGPRGAPAVILLHGFGSSLETWDAWVQGLSVRHRVIRFDLPGSGLSLPDLANDYTDARSLALLLEIMDHFGLQRASLVGHSIGGRIAWTFAALHPERIDKLVLVAPDGFASPGFAYGRPAKVPLAFKAMRYVLPEPMVRVSLAPAYANPATLTDALLTRYDDLLLAPGVRAALLARMEQTVLVDPRPLLARVQADTLLVWGDLDAMIPVANSADYLSALPRARLVRFPDTGHLPQEEAAERSLAAVDEFL
jgi:pimeloyl-ACP methyl ester carboxylesterase